MVDIDVSFVGADERLDDDDGDDVVVDDDDNDDARMK